MPLATIPFLLFKLGQQELHLSRREVMVPFRVRAVDVMASGLCESDGLNGRAGAGCGPGIGSRTTSWKAGMPRYATARRLDVGQSQPNFSSRLFGRNTDMEIRPRCLQ